MITEMLLCGSAVILMALATFAGLIWYEARKATKGANDGL